MRFSAISEPRRWLQPPLTCPCPGSDISEVPTPCVHVRCFVLCSSLVASTRRILKSVFFFFLIFLLLLLLLTSDSHKTNVTKAPFLACSSAWLWLPAVPCSCEKGLEEFNSCFLPAAFRLLLLFVYSVGCLFWFCGCPRLSPVGCSVPLRGGVSLRPPPRHPVCTLTTHTMGKWTVAVNRSCWLLLLK